MSELKNSKEYESFEKPLPINLKIKKRHKFLKIYNVLKLKEDI